MKTFKTWLAAIAVLLCSITANAHDFVVDGIYYKVTSNTTVRVTYRGDSYNDYSDEYSGNVVIPSTVRYSGKEYSVTSIGYHAFYSCDNLTSITIPNSVTSIGDEAFRDCSSLWKVLNFSNLNITKGSSGYGYVGFYAYVVANNAELIDNYVFAPNGNTYALYGYMGTDTNLQLPEKYKGESYIIGGYAFYDCFGLTSVTIPNSVTSIGDYAFYRCSDLTSVTIPYSVTSIGYKAFYGCSSLRKVLNFSNLNITKGSSGYGYVGYDAYVVANNAELIDNYVFAPNGNTYALYGYMGTDTNLQLPEKYKGENYVIGDYAFSYCSGLTSVTIPNSVTSIGEYAFYGCSGLTSVTIGNSVTSIGEYAFSDCSGLTSVTIPNSVTSIGHWAFYGCHFVKENFINNSSLSAEENNYWGAKLHDYETEEGLLIDSTCVVLCRKNAEIVTIPNSVTSIGKYAFYGCSGLTSVTIPNSVTSIGDEAFYDCFGLTSVTIPNSVTSIGSGAFRGCSGLTSIVVEDENTVYDSRNNCNAIIETASNMLLCGCQTTVIPNSVTSIGSGAFRGCSGLTSVTIPNSVTSIGDYAFYGCSGLTSVTIGNSVDYIGSSAFFRCNRLAIVLNLSDLDISRGSKSHGYVAYYAERVYNADEMVGDYAFKESDGKNYLVRYVGDDKSITLPENYKENNYNIGDEAFYGCGFLTSIVIPNSVQVIGNDAFYGCKLSSLAIGTGVRSIGSSSSESNKPKKVFWLPSRCPDGYKNLDGELNYVPNDQYYVSNRKIYPYLSSMFEVNNMKYVPVSPAERTCDLLDCIYDSLGSVVEIEESVSYKGIPMTVQNVGAHIFYGLKNIKEVYVSSSVQKSAFAYCDSLTKVTFGDNAKIIGASAFEGCSSLSDVKIGTNVRSIEDNAFKDCSYLNNIEIADSVENIGVSAFSGCSSLSAIAIPQVTETIKSSAFSGCSSLTNVAIEDRTTNLEFGGDVFNKCPLDSVYIGGKINGTPFSVNKSLRSVAFANNVDSIYAEEFYGCSNLKNVAMGDAVSSIGYQAFSGCSSLASFTFASAMKTIGGKAFSGCTSMTSLISLATTPPACGNLALDDIDKWSCVLKVPESSISAYQAADGWKEFFFIESLPTAITEITEDGNHCNGTNVYTIGGMKVTNTGKLSKGIYIVDGKKVIID